MGRQQRNTLILALVLLLVLSALLVLWLLPRDRGAKAVVQVGGQEDRVVSLSKDQEFWVGDEEIGRNLIRVKDGTIMVAEADCPDKVCVHTGPIGQEGQVIACLPHGVIVYIQREGE